MFDVQVCMVSAQAAPNLLPLLDEQLKPKEVILLVSEKMKPQATYLQDVIKPMGIKVRQQTFEATGNFQQLQNQLEALINEYPEQSIALNVTGGTKWMAITAQEVFRSYGQPVFYVDIDTDSIFFVDSERAPLTLTARIKLKNYLLAYGYEIKSEKIGASGLTSDQRELCQYMVAYVEEWGGAIGQLNRLASEAEQKKTLSVSLSLLEKSDSYLEALLKQCVGSGILQHEKDKKQIYFADEKARFFANGGWLEEYINGRLNELKADGVLQDNSHLNLRIGSPNSTNEIDVAFMARNRLHLIECKTRRLTGAYAGSAGTESLYKLDSISELGGLGTRSMLVSYRPLGVADKQRASDLRIKVVEGIQLKDIKAILMAWIQYR
jgi:hypothetical protein